MISEPVYAGKERAELAKRMAKRQKQKNAKMSVTARCASIRDDGQNQRLVDGEAWTAD